MKPETVIITTCMGRAFHLRETLPLMLAQDYDDFVVLIVDWTSPDDLTAYLSKIPSSLSLSKLIYTYISGKEYFSLSGARNAGGQFLLNSRLNPKYLAFIDADVKLPPYFLSKNIPKLKGLQKAFLQRNKTVSEDLGIWGSCIVPFEGWKTARYNEEINTYGEEDNEFYNVLISQGYQKISMETEGIEIIAHSDELRMKFYKESPKDIPELKRKNKEKFRVPNA